MTIASKNSRKIVLDGETYTWVISPDDGYIVFVAEHSETKGRRIQVYINSDIDKFWLNFPHCESLNLRVIKPKNAKSIISQAIDKGWNPKQKGNPMVFDLIEDSLTKR